MAGAELAPLIALRAPAPGEDELSRLRSAVDLPRLIEAGYDADDRVFRPAPAHPVFGYSLCPVAGCTAAVGCDGLCRNRGRRFERFEGKAALPYQEEIDRVRYLIGRIREAMGELTPAERAELQELLAAERTNRSAILERLPARHQLNVLNVGATFDGMAC
jgi:hypothetical protein